MHGDRDCHDEELHGLTPHQLSEAHSPTTLGSRAEEHSLLSFGEIIHRGYTEAEVFERKPESNGRHLSTATTGIHTAEQEKASSMAVSDVERPRERNSRRSHSRSEGCRCDKTKCLKLYCECFANSRFCSERCRCKCCHNKEELKEIRDIIINETLEKNPAAFRSKYKKREATAEVLHSRGCTCRKTSCQKNYCECFRANIGCSQLCKCSGCKNSVIRLEDSEVTLYYEKVLRKRKRIASIQDFYLSKLCGE